MHSIKLKRVHSIDIRYDVYETINKFSSKLKVDYRSIYGKMLLATSFKAILAKLGVI